MLEKSDQTIRKARYTGHSLDRFAVFFVKAYQNVVICLGEIVNDTIDIGFDILRTLDIQMPVGADMQCVGDAEMVPEKFVQRRVLVYPDNLVDGDNGISIEAV